MFQTAYCYQIWLVLNVGFSIRYWVLSLNLLEYQAVPAYALSPQDGVHPQSFLFFLSLFLPFSLSLCSSALTRPRLMTPPARILLFGGRKRLGFISGNSFRAVFSFRRKGHGSASQTQRRGNEKSLYLPLTHSTVRRQTHTQQLHMDWNSNTVLTHLDLNHPNGFWSWLLPAKAAAVDLTRKSFWNLSP